MISYGVALLLAISVISSVAFYLRLRRVNGEIQRLTKEALYLAQCGACGELASSAFLSTLRPLKDAIETLAIELQDRVRTIGEQRNEQRLILASMVEGVLAVDDMARIMNVNEACRRILDRTENELLGRSVRDSIGSEDLEQFISRALCAECSLIEDLELRPGEERLYQARATPLQDEEGERIGTVIVLSDISRERRLERMRRDFVANVSHELKTPITSIRGFLETLLDGALKDEEAAERFVTIANRHAERLGAIVNDLLSLSRLEQGSDSSEVEFESVEISSVVGSAVCLVEELAARSQVQVIVDTRNEALVEGNSSLLQQAVVNLVENAIKYSVSGGIVRVSIISSNGEAVLRVEDRGCGMGAEHLPRVFERFYRVDRGRSRQEGGTGLGLAIVKHVALAHRGRVEVESTVGEGSVFSLYLPILAYSGEDRSNSPPSPKSFSGSFKDELSVGNI